MAIQNKRSKDVIMAIRLTEHDRDLVKSMADQAGMSMASFVMSRVWGEVSESPKPPTETKSNLEDIKGRLGLKTATELIPSCQADEQPAPDTRRPRRDFNGRQSSRYNIVKREDWGGQVLEDKETGQFFVHVNGHHQEYGTAQEAIENLERMGG